MSALIAAELLRLRTVRTPRYGALGVLALVAITTAVNVGSIADQPGGSTGLAESLWSLALPGVLMAGLLAATSVATEFQRGSAAMTYLSHPHRADAAAARALVHAVLGFLFAGLAAGAVVAIGVPALDESVDAGLWDVARLVAATAFGGAVMGAAGALIGTATRNPTVASSALPGWYVVELLLVPADIRPYLPFSLVSSLMGAAGEVSAPVAIGLLLAFLAAAALFVREWALPRDVT
jgi:ABC-type transport system involved in multi-copper enzyme maturation permease subunit